MKFSILIFLAACGGVSPATIAADPIVDAAFAEDVREELPIIKCPNCNHPDAAEASIAADAAVEAAQEASPMCTPIASRAEAVTCPIGGGSADLYPPAVFLMADGNGCAYPKTPPACLCAETYSCECLQAQNACGPPSGFFGGQWGSCVAQGDIFYVTCQ